ncbi:hypothetical protein BH23BAC3_BH23BAC3_17210 [soil metagenome]
MLLSKTCTMDSEPPCCWPAKRQSEYTTIRELSDELDIFPVNTAWLWQPILFGSMLIFPFSLSESVITPAMHYTAIFGALLFAGSFGLNLYFMVKTNTLKGFIWNTILVLMGVKILLQVATILPLDIWPGEHGLRVLYLHILLL